MQIITIIHSHSILLSSICTSSESQVHSATFQDSLAWNIFEKAILPVLLFAGGYILNNLIETRKHNKRLKDYRLYFISLTNLVCELANYQARELERLAILLENIDSREVSASHISGFPNKSLADINHTDLFKAFIQGTDVKHSTNKFNTLLAQLNHIQFIVESISEYSEEFENLVSELDKRWSENGKSLTTTFSEIAGTRDINKVLESDDPYIQMIGEIMNDIHEKKWVGYTALYENTIVKFLNFINQPENIDDSRNQLITPIITEFQHIIEQRKDIFSRRSNSCKDTASSLLHAKNSIEGIISELKN